MTAATPPDHPKGHPAQTHLDRSSLDGLDWGALCSHLAEAACFTENRPALLALGRDAAPSAQSRDELFALTAEMLRALAVSEEAFAFSDVAIDATLASLRLGRTLVPDELLAVRRILEQAGRLCAFLAGSEAALRRKDYPKLTQHIDELRPDRHLADRLAASISDEAVILDSASPGLRDARATLRAAERKLIMGLEGLLKSSSVRDALQDPLWMERDGRYVLPVRTDRKSSVEGVTIGVSQSGSTLFIEPHAVAGMRVALDAARRDEQIELHKVLTELTRSCQKHIEGITSAAQGLLFVDQLRARALFARRLGGTRPELHNDPQASAFDLVRARHPLFVLEQKPCVPHDFSFSRGEGSRPPCMLVLSGPNAGGKTVTMKLLGLYALMAREGLFVPADRARLYAFERVLAAIGDSQSLQDDLSTFSAHLKTVRYLVQEATNRSLVLLDEGFVGTDPAVGAALARAVLEDLAAKRICTIITTHFSPLKTIADDNPAFLNASMEFELGALKSTYRLLVGIPGQSYALELAQRMGFAATTLERARELHGKEAGRLERLLQELQEARTKVEEERKEQALLRRDLESERDALTAEVRRVSDLRQNLVKDYEDKLQKRLNAFRNALEIRERQYFRSRQNLLDALEQRQASSQQDTPSQPAEARSAQGTQRDNAPKQVPKSKPDSAPAKPKAPQSIKDFADLAKLTPSLSKGGRGLPDSRHPHQRNRKWLSGSEWDASDVDDLIDIQRFADSDASPEELMAEAEEVFGGLRGEFGDLEHELDNTIKGQLGVPAQGKPLSSGPTGPRSGLPASTAQDAARPAAHPAQLATPLKRGDRVTCSRFSGTGEVLEAPTSKGMVTVSFKGLKTRLHTSELVPAKDRPSDRSASSGDSAKSTPARPQPQRGQAPLAVLDVTLPPIAVFPSRTVDLRGQERDVALEHLDRFVDKALLEDMPSFAILHGHGTGAVKKAVREWLAKKRLACRYRPGTAGEGGDGVTVVVLD